VCILQVAVWLDYCNHNNMHDLDSNNVYIVPLVPDMDVETNRAPGAESA